VLRSARLKFDRAVRQLEELDQAIRGSFDGKPYLITNEKDSDSSGVLSVEIVRDFPEDVGLLAGETAHGFRCALDHVVYAVSSGRTKARSYFPICTVEADYIGPRENCLQPMRDSGLGGVPKKLLTVFDAAQPYHRRKRATQHPLARLARLDNADKHRVIQPAATVAQDLASIHLKHDPRPLPSGEPRQAHVEWLIAGQALECRKKTDVFRWAISPDLPPDTDVNVRLQPRMTVAFGNACTIKDLYATRDLIITEIIEPIEAKLG
jgi:hypothetical protein